MKKEAYEVEYYEPKSVLAMQADRREEKHRRKQKKGIRAGRILLGVAILLFWEVSARLGWIDDYYWSSPSLIAQTAIVQWKEKNLAYDIYFTSMSTIGGFLAGTLGGAVLGLSFWWSKTFAKIFEPYLVMFNAIPKLALAPILIVLFGIGFSSKVMLAFLMTVISCALATVSGVENVDESMETLLYSLGAARWQVFGKVVVPAVSSVDAWKPPDQYFTGACGSNRRRIYRIGARTWQNGHLCGNYSGYHVSVGWCDRSVAACDGDVFCGGGTGKMDDGTSGDLS